MVLSRYKMREFQVGARKERIGGSTAKLGTYAWVTLCAAIAHEHPLFEWTDHYTTSNLLHAHGLMLVLRTDYVVAAMI